MNIIVFIKQIPDSDEVKLDENGNLIRSGAGTMINPVDKMRSRPVFPCATASAARSPQLPWGRRRPRTF